MIQDSALRLHHLEVVLMKQSLAGKEAPPILPKTPRGRDVTEARRRGCLAESTAVRINPNTDDHMATWRLETVGDHEMSGLRKVGMAEIGLWSA